MAGTKKTEENVKAYHAILDIYGGKNGAYSVQTYWDEIKENWVDIVTYQNSPINHITSYATIGLSDFSIGKKVNNISLGVEIVGACHKNFDNFANILSTCAFNIIVEKSSCFPGCIYPDVIEMYMVNSEMKHILFVSPFGWDKEFRTLDFTYKKIAWLQVVPISEMEYQYVRTKGEKALEALLEENQIDVYDLNRKSIL